MKTSLLLIIFFLLHYPTDLIKDNVAKCKRAIMYKNLTFTRPEYNPDNLILLLILTSIISITLPVLIIKNIFDFGWILSIIINFVFFFIIGFFSHFITPIDVIYTKKALIGRILISYVLALIVYIITIFIS